MMLGAFGMKIFNENRMKKNPLYHVEMRNKRACYILALLIGFSFTGCDKANDNNRNIELENTITVTVSPTTSLTQNNAIEKRTQSDDLEIINELSERLEVDYSDCFQGLEGCAVFLNSDTNVYSMYKEELCEQRSSPCSTFKIITTLMGLDQEIITSVDSTMDYDGTIYSMDQWNKDLSLKEAFQESCVWYFRKIVDKVGQSNVQNYLDKLEYGNRDISEWEGSKINSLPELNGFWIESSLEISPKEQVDILSDIFHGKTDFSQHNIDILKTVMFLQKVGDVSVYGKTGSGKNLITNHKDNGWFVGMLENSEGRHFFAVHLVDEKEEVSGVLAKEIALNIIDRYYADSN
jgi:beta-lactamase class D